MTMYEILRSTGIRLFGVTTPPPSFLPCRLQNKLPQSPRAVILCAFPYFSSQLTGNISKYAMVEDYHRVVGTMLHKAADALKEVFPGEYASFTDHSPIPEVTTAARAGLGRIGKNGLLIHPQYGSFLFLGAMVTDYPFPTHSYPISSCAACNRCRSHCPTGALTPSSFVKERCLSFLTQSKQPPNAEMAEKMRKNGLIWGCDVCQDCCPQNQNLPTTFIPAFQRNLIKRVTAEILQQELSNRAFTYRGNKVLLRNLRIVEGAAAHTSMGKEEIPSTQNERSEKHYVGKRPDDASPRNR